VTLRILFLICLPTAFNGGAKDLKNHVLAIESDSGEGMKVIHTHPASLPRLLILKITRHHSQHQPGQCNSESQQCPASARGRGF